MEADERHGAQINKDMGIVPGSNGVVPPVVREGASEGEIAEKLSRSESSN